MGHGVWALALVFGCLGFSLLVLSLRARSARGLGFGETAVLDDVTLFSKRYLLTGRPDRIVKHGKFFIPEEWKSSKKVEPWHLVQLGVYFILIEDHYGVRPAHGFIVLQGGRRERVENTRELRERVLAVAAEIRERRGRLEEEIQVSPALAVPGLRAAERLWAGVVGSPLNVTLSRPERPLRRLVTFRDNGEAAPPPTWARSEPPPPEISLFERLILLCELQSLYDIPWKKLYFHST